MRKRSGSICVWICCVCTRYQVRGFRMQRYPIEPKPLLTIRKPDAILALQLDLDDNIIGDRLLAKSQTLTILGPGGVGSRG